MSDNDKGATPPAGTEEQTPEERIRVLEGRVRAFGAEAKRYRQARNDALRMGAALRTVLDAHGVTHQPDAEALAGLPIANGEVIGEYAYKAPTPEPASSPAPTAAKPGAGGWTDEQIKNMSDAEYEKHRDAILASMGRKD